MKKRYKAALFLPAAAAAYFLAAWTLSSFRVNNRQSGGEITLFLVSNGTHVDVVMPLKNNIFDWTQTVSPADSGSGGSGTEYIGLGWGERNFYLNTPSWGDLTVPTALRALSGFNRTLIHATYYPSEPAENENTVRFSASPEQYRRLAAALRDGFRLQNGRAVAVAGAHYHSNDAFYEAEGRYHLFNTCNTWLNGKLTRSGMKGVVWTPFAGPLLDSYR